MTRCLPAVPLPDMFTKDFVAAEAGWLRWLDDLAAGPF